MKKRILSLFLAILMFTSVIAAFPPLSVGAAEMKDYYPEVYDTGNYTEIFNTTTGELRFAYAFADNDIPCNKDFEIEWSDDFYKYYTVVKVLDGKPNPGPNTSGEEKGSPISKYTHEKKDNYTYSYLELDKSDLQKYAGKYIKVAIIGYNKDESYSCRSDTYFYIAPAEEDLPEVKSVEVSPDEVSVSEPFTITVKTTSDASGVVIYVDDKHKIVTLTSPSSTSSSSKTFKYTYSFRKTDKEDDNGNDITNIRYICAYPIDQNGIVHEDYDLSNETSIRVNPAEFVFDDFEVDDVTIEEGNKVKLTWETAKSNAPATPSVTYMVYLYINGKSVYVGETTNTSATFSWSELEEVGVEAATYGIMVLATANGHRQKQCEGLLTVNEADDEIPQLSKIILSSNSIRVAEDLTITVTANSATAGVAFYVDNESTYIGKTYTTSSSNTFVFVFQFSKTGSSGTVDQTQTRTIYAKPINENGDVVSDAIPIAVRVAVNPAKYIFDDFEVYTAQTTINQSVTITWENVSSESDATVYYNLWVDNELVAEKLTKNSYTLSVNEVKNFGVGKYGIMVMATAYEHRQKQSVGELKIYNNGDDYPGDVNGDGEITALDVTKLRKYLANTDSTAIPKDGSISKGADVNEDGKINGKDLTALLVMLERGNVPLPEPEPEPEPPVVPEVEHTYTVRIPLEKADLKATTGRTIYIMPLGGYFALRVYDENGKEYSFKEAGIWWKFSDHTVLQYWAGTLSATKCGYSEMTIYQEDENGDLVELAHFEIHVASSQLSKDQWPSMYQFVESDKQYISNYLDFALSDFEENMPRNMGIVVTIDAVDIINEAGANLKLYIKNFLGGEDAVAIERYKHVYAAFYKEFGNQITPDDELDAAARVTANIISGLVKRLGVSNDWYDAADDVWKFFSKSEISLFKQIIKTINDSNITPKAAKEAYKSLVSLLGKAVNHFDEFISAFNNSSVIRNFIESKGIIKIKNALDIFSKTKILSKIFEVLGKVKPEKISTALAGLEMIAYVASDYTYSVQAMRSVLDVLYNLGFDDENRFHKALNDLVYEYEHKFISGLSDFMKNVAYNAVEGLVCKVFPLYSVAVFVAGIVGNATTSPEKFDYAIMIALTGLIQVTMKQECKYEDEKILSASIRIGSLPKQEMLISMYISSYVYQLKLLKKITIFDSATEKKIDNAISKIQTEYAHFLDYKVS